MLELHHISKTYQTSKKIKTHALKDINLKFPSHGMIFILGKSGSGKSTLLNIIGGLDQADEGEIRIHGKSSKTFTTSDYDAYRNTYIGFIFQEFYLIEEYTIEKNIALSLQLQNKEATKETINDILTKVGLQGLGSRYPNELSGGQKQRVAIARSLIKQPEILMADEPTGALDSSTGKEIFDTLKELSKEKLVIVVSHDEEAAKRYADRIIRFKDGNIIEDTCPDVEEDQAEFHPIHSHLPMKNSVYFGLSCLKHKKIRMIFTILLTSFALLTLALSDCVQDFNGINAQYKAMQDIQHAGISIQRQYVNEDGVENSFYMDALLEIEDKDAAKIINDTSIPMAKVYDSQEYRFRAETLQIQILDPSIFDNVTGDYYISEFMNEDFFQSKEIIGQIPKNNEQAMISSYLADLIITHGMQDQDGKQHTYETYEDIIQHTRFNIANKTVTISGIVKTDLSKYEYLKNIAMNAYDEEYSSDYRQLYAIVHRSENKIFVKDGFVESLHLKKSNDLYGNNCYFTLHDQTSTTYINSLKYLDSETTYYDGSGMKKIIDLKENEILLSFHAILNYAMDSGNEAIFNDQFYNDLTKAQQDERVKQFANRLINKKQKLTCKEFYNAKDAMIETDVVIKGVVLPDNYQNISDPSSIVAKGLIEQHIRDPFYLGELFSYAEAKDAKKLLNAYPMENEFMAASIASDEVKTIKSMTDFVTKVFFVASIAFFIFAAVLMMNFIISSINYRKKEIGILRSIGARSIDVVKIFIWETLILAIISYLITIVALFILSMLVNGFAHTTIGWMISPIIITMRQPVLLIAIVLMIAAIACFVPILRIAKQRPIDAIKK